MKKPNSTKLNSIIRNLTNKQCDGYAALLIITGYIIILCVPLIYNKGPHMIMDQPAWTAVAHIMAQDIIRDQQWFWGTLTDRQNAGLILGHIYSLNLVIIYLLTQVFTAELAVKIFLMICILVFMLAFYAICRMFMGTITASISCFLILPKVFPVAVQGMCYSHLSMGISLFFWVISIKYFNDMKMRQWILAVLLFTLSIYAHPIGAISSFIIWFSLLLGIFIAFNRLANTKVVLTYFFVPFIGLLFAGPQVHAVTTQKGVSSIINYANIFEWKYYFNNVVDIIYPAIRSVDYLIFFACVGIFALWKRKTKYILPIIGLCFAGIFLISKIALLLPGQHDLFAGLLYFSDRFMLYLNIVYFLIVGIGINFLYRNSKIIELSQPKMRMNAGQFGILVILVPFAFSLGPNVKIYSQRHDYFMTLNTFENKEELKSLWSWINKNIKYSDTRIYFEDTFGTYPWAGKWGKGNNYNHSLALTSIYTESNQIGGWYGIPDEFSRNYSIGYGGYLFSKHNPAELNETLIKDGMKLLNCRYLVANSSGIKEYLDSVSFLKNIVNIGLFRIYEYTTMQSAWAYRKDHKESVTLNKISTNRYKISVKGKAGEKIIISLAYNPNWRALYENREIHIFNYKALMEIKLPVSGYQTIDIVYRIERKIPLLMIGCGFILFAVVAIGAFAVPNGKERKRIDQKTV